MPSQTQSANHFAQLSFPFHTEQQSEDILSAQEIRYAVILSAIINDGGESHPYYVHTFLVNSGQKVSMSAVYRDMDELVNLGCLSIPRLEGRKKIYRLLPEAMNYLEYVAYKMHDTSVALLHIMDMLN